MSLMSNRRFGLMSVALALIVGLAVMMPGVTLAATEYQPTWESVNQHPPVPEWFKDAKFGLWFHWGVYCVPAYSMEWYPKYMYQPGGKEIRHHTEKYDSPEKWPYNYFITGAKDRAGNWTQFAPRLKSEGGKFDPAEWAQLFESAGAKIAGPVCEHHDGFSMWASKVNPWNAMSKGPKLDLVKVLIDAFRARNMKIICSFHHAWNCMGAYYHFAPKQSDRELQILFGQLPKAEEEQLWFDKIKEVIDGYQPDWIWQDIYVRVIGSNQRLKFLAYYYNKANEWNKEVVASYYDGLNGNGQMLQYERCCPDGVTPFYWMSEDAISGSSWSYVEGMKYRSAISILHNLIDRVSKNGNFLLNISPMADGTIPQEQKGILLDVGDWLRKFGESIYSTRAWEVYGEGPTNIMGKKKGMPFRAGTAQDIRFTRNKENTVLYAIVLGWPGDGATVKIATLNSKKFDATGLAKVTLLGETADSSIALSHAQDADAFNVTMPATKPHNALAYVVKFSFSQPIRPLLKP